MNDRLNESLQRTDEIIAVDPGARGIAALHQAGALLPAAQALRTATGVAIVSGFYIPNSEAAETDGPPGALALGNALRELRVPVTYVTDQWCLPVFATADFDPLVRWPASEPGVDAGVRNPTRDSDPQELVPSIEWLREQLDSTVRLSHLVSIERVGRAEDGGYYNMRGEDISKWTASLDALFLEAAEHEIGTIGVGDGGNEIGMGAVAERVRRSIANGDRIACVVPVDHRVVAGTSNWGAWGLVAALSLSTGADLLPTAPEASEQLRRLVDAGAVDGVTGRNEPTVDGLDWSTHAGVLDRLRRIVDEFLAPQGRTRQ